MTPGSKGKKMPAGNDPDEAPGGVALPPQHGELRQMVVNPLTGRDVTGSYMDALMQDYRAERGVLFDTAEARRVAGDPTQETRRALVEGLRDLQARTGDASKGAVRQCEEFEADMERALGWPEQS